MGGGWPTFRFLKGGIPHAYPAWDLWILRMRPLVLYFSGSSPDEKEARRCMSPRLPTFAKNKGAKVGQPAWHDPPASAFSAATSASPSLPRTSSCAATVPTLTSHARRDSSSPTDQWIGVSSGLLGF